MTAARDWHGVRRAYVRDGIVATALVDLVRDPLVLDRRGVLAAWGQLDDPLATIVAGVRQLRCRERGASFGGGVQDRAQSRADDRHAGPNDARDSLATGAFARHAGPNDARGSLATDTFARHPDGLATDPARAVGADHALHDVALEGLDSSLAALRWRAAFEGAVAAIASTTASPIVALGGGVDAAAVLVAWRASGAAMPAACTLATGLAGYDEVDDATAIARALGVRCDVIRCAPEALVALAPGAAVVAETPLYNLHPVHRLALAREVHRRGFATLVTGDGADAVFANAPDLDYVPIVAALVRVAGLELASPFFADAVVDGTPRDRSKQLLRAYVREAGLAWLAERPKRSRLVPALDLTPIVDAARIDRLAHALDLPPRLDSDQARVGWATLDHLARALGPRAIGRRP